MDSDWQAKLDLFSFFWLAFTLLLLSSSSVGPSDWLKTVCPFWLAPKETHWRTQSVASWRLKVARRRSLVAGRPPLQLRAAAAERRATGES